MNVENLEIWSAELIRVGESKDKEAYARLFGHFAPRIKSLMLRYGITDQLAEEIAQETFVLIWRKAEQFDATKAVASTWIYTIARNTRIDLLRKRNRPEPDYTDPHFHPEPELSGEEITSNKERALAVQKAIRLLPKDQRDVLLKAYYSEDTHAEIAKDLQTPLGTVKSRLRLALAKLKATLGEELGEDLE
jgi:RNA polymerase sigma-70 factor (ECF subfamily)